MGYSPQIRVLIVCMRDSGTYFFSPALSGRSYARLLTKEKRLSGETGKPQFWREVGTIDVEEKMSRVTGVAVSSQREDRM